jgi:GT2 family glycosyltransferase
MPPLVFVSVLNWRDPAETLACVDMLAAVDYPNKKIFISNNGHRETLTAALGTSLLDVEILHNERNLGFSGGNNLVIRKALQRGADYIWLFNSDAIPDPGSLSALVAAMQQDTRIGLISPVIYHDDDRSHVWNAGGCFDVRRCVSEWFTDIAEASRFEVEQPQRFMVAGTALLIRADMVRKIGGLDEALFAYYEDVDYSIRAAKAGYSRHLAVHAAIFHKHDVRSPPSPHACYYISRNDTRLWRRHSPLCPALRGRFWGLATAVASHDRHVGDSERQHAFLTGWWHGQIGVTGEWDRQHRLPAWLKKLLSSRLTRKVVAH